MPHQAYIGTLPGDSSHYHRTARGAPLWAACKRVMLDKRYLDDEDFILERAGLSPCPRCWKGEK